MKDGFKKVGIGLLGIILLFSCIYGFFNFPLNYEMWNTENIKPELSGNPALDEHIIRGAGESNFTALLMIYAIIAGMIIVAFKSVKYIVEGSKDILFKR